MINDLSANNQTTRRIVRSLEVLERLFLDEMTLFWPGRGPPELSDHGADDPEAGGSVGAAGVARMPFAKRQPAAFSTRISNGKCGW